MKQTKLYVSQTDVYFMYNNDTDLILYVGLEVIQGHVGLEVIQGHTCVNIW